MCWCKDCKWYYEEHCVNWRSDNCTDSMGDFESCIYSEMNEEARTAEYDKGYTDGFWEAKKNVR